MTMRAIAHPPILIAMLAAISTLSGCGEGASGSSADTFALRDSAGVRIADNRGAAWAAGAGWRLADMPALEIGLADGAPEYLLNRVQATVRRADGTIVLANGGTQEIRFYDAEGRHLRSVGGPGGGPGEFQRLVWMDATRGDSILAYDLFAQRLSTFSPDGDFVRAVNLDGFESLPQLQSVFEDGSLVVKVTGTEGMGGEDGIATTFATFHHASPTGAPLEVLYKGPPERAYQTTASSGGAMTMSVVPEMFGASAVGVAAGDSLFIGRNDHAELVILSSQGDVRGRLRYSAEPRPVTDAMVTAADRARGRPSGPGPMEEALRNRPRAEVLPFFTDAIVDRSGNLWLHEHGMPGNDDPSRWLVFDAEGRLLGLVAMPDGFTPRYIDDEHVLGVSRDELDVERVQLYPIEKS